MTRIPAGAMAHYSFVAPGCRKAFAPNQSQSPCPPALNVTALQILRSFGMTARLFLPAGMIAPLAASSTKARSSIRAGRNQLRRRLAQSSGKQIHARRRHGGAAPSSLAQPRQSAKDGSLRPGDDSGGRGTSCGARSCPPSDRVIHGSPRLAGRRSPPAPPPYAQPINSHSPWRGTGPRPAART